MNNKPSKTAAQAPQLSSTSFTLQQLNKETEKKELAVEAAKAQQKDESKNEQRCSQNPLSLEPKPTKPKEIEKDKINENEKQLTSTLSPFKMKPW